MQHEISYHGPERRYNDSRLSVLEANLHNLIESNDKHHCVLDDDLNRVRDQSHEWLQAIDKTQEAMLNRLPVWAVSVITLGSTALGGMAMWILTHH